jgi:hypothetical protein
VSDEQVPTILLTLPWSPDHIGGVNAVGINLHRGLPRE